MADRQPGRLPLGKSILQPTRPVAPLTQYATASKERTHQGPRQ